MIRRLAALALADFRERTRRYAFLVTLAATGWLAYGVLNGNVWISLDGYRGVMNSAWAGTLTAVVTAVVVGLAGFWVVKSAVERDRRTGVGQILAATAMSSRAYLFGKFVSNVAVLGTIVAAMAACAAILPWFRGGGAHLDPFALLVPFLLLAVPAILVTAALAVAFETIPLLAGGFGNVTWLFFWSFMLAAPIVASTPWADVSGILTVQQDAARAVKARYPSYETGFALQIGGSGERVKGTFEWDGIVWTPSLVAPRVGISVFALLLVAVSAAWFDRFDENRGRRGNAGSGGAPAVPQAAEGSPAIPAAAPAAAGHLTPLPAGSTSGARLVSFAAGEVRLLLRGRPWWWLAVAAGLVVAGFAAPLEAARAHVLPLAWLWPVLLWSSLGSREARFGVESIVFSAPRPLAVQIPAQYAAGVLVAVVTSSGVGLRLAAAASWGPFVGWLGGALLIPAAALAAGAWSGTGKLFESLYVVLWYVGPFQPTPALDFMGVSDAAIDGGMPRHCLVLAAVLLAAAVAGRRRRIRL